MSVIDYSWDFTKEEFSFDLDFFNEKDQEDRLWQARTGLDSETLCGAIETIIFMSDKPITLQKIKTQIDSDLPLRVCHESISRLQAEYEAKHHGIRLMEVAQGYQFRTKATYSKIVQSMFKVSSLQLSPTALEVMAIIAYKQPISKNVVESVRGVDSSHIIRALMDKRLVKVVGRSEEMGRPSLYGTTNEFLEVFNLNEINELPSETELEEIATANELGEISDIKTIVQTGDKKKFDFDELAELDDLSTSIREIAADTIFTQTLKQMDRKRNTEEGVEKKSAFDILEEHVNIAQVATQNKTSSESEVLTSVMEPKSVAASDLNLLLNFPVEEEEFEIEVELEEDIEMMADAAQENVIGRELPEVSEKNFEEMSSEDVNDLETQADIALEKSEKLMEQLLNADSEEIEVMADAHTNSLVIEEEEEQVEEISAPIANTDFSDIDDISKFIAAKLEAQAPVEAKEEESVVDEAKELSDALDMAFDNLMGGSDIEEPQESSDEDMDIDISSIKFDQEDITENTNLE